MERKFESSLEYGIPKQQIRIPRSSTKGELIINPGKGGWNRVRDKKDVQRGHQLLGG